MIEFFEPCTPPKATAQQQKVAIICGKVRKYDPKNVKDAKKMLSNLLSKHAPESPVEGEVMLEVEWRYPMRKSEPKRRREAAESKNLPCGTRPDCDNILKSFCDELTKAGFLHDDSQIADLRFKKCWSLQSGIYLKLTKIIDFMD